MSNRRGGFGKDTRPIGVTKSMLAVRQELQNYGVKNSDKITSLLGKDQRRFGGQDKNKMLKQQSTESAIEENPEALYPPMQVPGQPRGSVPYFP